MEPLGKLVFRAWGWMSCRLRVSGKGRCGEDLPTNAGSFQQKLWYHGYGSFRKFGVPYFGVLIIRILLFRVLY